MSENIIQTWAYDGSDVAVVWGIVHVSQNLKTEFEGSADCSSEISSWNSDNV